MPETDAMPPPIVDLDKMAELDEIQRLKRTKDYDRLKKHYKDREWRLDNLYQIINEHGTEVLFVRNAAQRAYMAAMWSRDLIAKARQIGFSSLIAILIGDTCVFRSNITAGIVDDTLDSAKLKLDKIRFAYDRMPLPIRESNPLIKKNTEELKWANGSSVTVGTSYRGGTAQIMHISELGRVSIDSPEAAIEIRTGSLRAVHANGWAVVESTAHGTSGEFCDMVRSAEAKQKEGRVLSALEFKLHFYGWWMKPEYRVPNNLVVLTQELREYFAEIAPKLKESGVKLDANQMAWYAVNYNDLGPDKMREEFPSTMAELFYSSLAGSYFRREIAKARQDGRIGQMVPYDSTRRVNTWWDIGEDCTAIIFHQTDGVRHRIIDYYEEEGGSLQRSAAVLDEKRLARGFIYGAHIGPHDLDNRDWGNNAQSRYQTALSLGIKFQVVPRVEVKADSIEAARRMLNLTWIDQEHCSLLVDRLENYRKKWNKALQVYSADPVHDMNSHGADSFQGGAMGQQQDRVPAADRSRPRPEPRRSSPWSA